MTFSVKRSQAAGRLLAGTLTCLFFACVGALNTAQAVQEDAVSDTKSDAADSGRPTNVIFILADDLGYGDLSCYGQKHFETPNIDALASRGMLFTQAYSGSTVCAPSRCCLMTGLHSGHAPVRGNKEIQPEGQAPMPADTKTVAHLFHKAGYTTAMFGKWGLGGPGTVSDPMKMGFDRFYGYNCQRQAHSYYPRHLWSDLKKVPLPENANKKTVTYAPELIQKEAIRFIKENKDDPFFIYYAAVQPHADMIAPEEYMEKHRGKYGEETAFKGGGYRKQPHPRAAFAAMVNVLDDYVGEVMSELETQGIADNTLVIFTSDNGPHVEGGHDPEYFDSNSFLTGVKRDLYEGGVRVPMIASWPGTIESGSQTDQLTAFWDFLPTVAEMIGQPITQMTDGVSMVPTLLGHPDQQRQHKYLYWEFPDRGGRVAIRKGDFKAVRYNITNDPNAPLELYELKEDVAETVNVATKYPQIASEMRGLFESARTAPENPAFDPYIKKPGKKSGNKKNAKANKKKKNASDAAKDDDETKGKADKKAVQQTVPK